MYKTPPVSSWLCGLYLLNGFCLTTNHTQPSPNVHLKTSVITGREGALTWSLQIELTILNDHLMTCESHFQFSCYAQCVTSLVKVNKRSKELWKQS